MKKILALVLTLALALCLAATAFADERPAWARSEEEVGDSITVYTTMDDGQQAIVEEVWYSVYPDCQIEWIKDSLGTLIARVRNESANPQADVICGGLFQTDGSQYWDCFDQYTPVNYDEQTMVDENHYYALQDIQYMCLIVSTKLEEELGVTIDGYQALLNPALSGKIIIADPTATSSGFRQFHTILALMGDEFGDEKAWTYLTDLVKNGVVNTTSSSEVYKQVMAGEYAVGLSYESIVQYQVENGAEDIRLVYPVEGNTGCANGSAMVKGCPHKAAAEAFLDMCGSNELQSLRAEANCARGTNKNFTYEAYPSDEEIGVKPLDYDYIAEHKEDLLNQWTELWSTYGVK